MDNKKTLINKKIEVYELKKHATYVVNKALRIMETHGNRYATEIIENKKYYKLDDHEDLIQLVCLNIIENDYTITKKSYYIVNQYINKKITSENVNIKTQKYDENEKKI